MNTYNNKRRQETVKRIEEVFLDFLQTRELSQIKVSDICKAAEINRSTFYSNFLDIYDLADKITAKLEAEVLGGWKQNKNWADDFLMLFEHIRENQALYACYFKLGYDLRTELKLYDFCTWQYDVQEENIDYHIAFFRNGFNAIVKKWLDGGCKESPQQIKDILMAEYRGRARQ